MSGALRAGRTAESGQAAVELVGGLPAVFALGLVVFQLFAVGYAKSLAGTASEAAALALAAGADPERAARRAVPGWTRARMRVRARDGVVTVAMRPPSPIGRVERALSVESRSYVRVR